MSRPESIRAHVIAGGFPPGSPAGHDMDFARLRLLSRLREDERVLTTVSSDFNDLERWLPGCRLLVTYVAGPYADDAQSRFLEEWLEAGGRWVGLHGTSGGKAARIEGQRGRRTMVRMPYHDVLGSFFLNHPPVRRFRVDVADPEHPLTRGLPASFEVMDELYLIELRDPGCHILLTTQLEKDPSPPGFGFLYDEDTSLLPDGRSRALGYTREVGRGGVTYVALGHCHMPLTNVQPFVDESVSSDRTTPLEFRGSWDAEPFDRLLRNALAWGTGAEA